MHAESNVCSWWPATGKVGSPLTSWGLAAKMLGGERGAVPPHGSAADGWPLCGQVCRGSHASSLHVPWNARLPACSYSDTGPRTASSIALIRAAKWCKGLRPEQGIEEFCASSEVADVARPAADPRIGVLQPLSWLAPACKQLFFFFPSGLILFCGGR